MRVKYQEQRKQFQICIGKRAESSFNTWLNLTPEKARNSSKMELNEKRNTSLRQFLDDFFKIVEKTAAQSDAMRQYIVTTGIKNSFNTTPNKNNTVSQTNSKWQKDKSDAE
jgi:hypothetical protein